MMVLAVQVCAECGCTNGSFIMQAFVVLFCFVLFFVNVYGVVRRTYHDAIDAYA